MQQIMTFGNVCINIIFIVLYSNYSIIYKIQSVFILLEHTFSKMTKKGLKPCTTLPGFR